MDSSKAAFSNSNYYSHPNRVEWFMVRVTKSPSLR